MSFSSDTKNELVKVKNPNQSIALCELMGAVAFGGKFKRENGNMIIQIVTENPKIARRIYQLEKEIAGINSKIKIHKTSSGNTYYQVCTENSNAVAVMLKLGFIGKPSDVNYFTFFRASDELITNTAKRKAFLRGAFLTCGSVMSPEKKYHMEFVTSNYGLHNDLYAVMLALGLKPRIVIRKGNFVVYFKSSDEIADILTSMGAFGMLMNFHNAKIIKEIRNNVNRTINCESANMRKMIDASVAQVQAIEKLMNNKRFDSLPENLKEVARLRLEYRECTLKELGEMLNPPLGKSGVNHRLRKIQEMADNC